jgi:hypothetical protein
MLPKGGGRYNLLHYNKGYQVKLLSFLLLGLLLTQTAQARKKCSQFKTYAEAKSYLDAKKPGYKSLV